MASVQFEVKEKREPDHGPSRSRARARLKDFGVSGRGAHQAMARHDDAKLTAILDEVERRWKSGGIKTLRACTVTVLHQFEGDIVPTLEQDRTARRREDAEAGRRRADEEKRRRDLEREFRKHQDHRLAEEGRALTELDAASLQEELVEHLRANVPFACEVYGKGGEDRAPVQNQLRDFKVRKLLPAGDRCIEDWRDSSAVTNKATPRKSSDNETDRKSVV